MSFPAVDLAISGAVATVTLNRPEALNAINVQVRDDLFQIWPALALDDAVKAVVLVGAGRAFCAGADVTEFGTAPSPVAARNIRRLRPVWQMLRAFPKPVVAGIHGYAIGAGVELVMLCDLRIAEAGSVFSVPEVTFGLIPGAGGSQSVPRAIRRPRALDLILTGRRIRAEEALRAGMITEVVQMGQAQARAQELGARLASLPDGAVQAAKRAIDASANLPYLAGRELERRLSRTLRQSRVSEP